MELAPLRPAGSPLGPLPFGRIVKSAMHLAKPLDANTLQAINAALIEHGLLVIEGQRGLSAEMEWSLISSLPWLDCEFSASLKSSNVAWW